MKRWLLIMCLAVLAQPALAQQSVDPRVFLALNAAQQAQQKGDYAGARKALAEVSAESGSLEEALVQRSLAYVAWAQGRNAEALTLLEKAVASGKLEAQMRSAEELNLARLNLSEKRYSEVVRWLAPQSAGNSDEVLQMLVQAYQGMGQPAKALPLAERYVKANPNADDVWLQFLVGVNADLKRYPEAERWQRQLLVRAPDQAKAWQQLAGLQQLANRHDKALATLRAAHAKGVRFSETDLDNLVALAGAAQQPWQGAKLLRGLMSSQMLSNTAARQERLGVLLWQARERGEAVKVLKPLAQNSGSAKHWLYVAQLEFEQGHWQVGLEALKMAERAGADGGKVRDWRQWAEGELRFAAEERSRLTTSR